MFRLSRKNGTFGTFLDASQQQFWKLALANLDAISFTGENAQTKFLNFFKDVRDIFARFKPFSGHSKDTAVSSEKSSDAVWKFSTCKFIKKFRVHFCDLRVQKQSCLLVMFRCISEVLCLQALQKKFWAHFHNLCVQKRNCLPWSSDAFRKFLPCRVYKKVLGALSPICVQKRSCLPWSSDTFQKFSAFKLYRKTSGCNFMICAVKREAVFCEVQMHFGNFRFARFWAHFHDLCVQQRICLLWSSDAFWKFSPCEVYKKCSRHIITIFASKNEAVFCEI